MCDYSLHAVPNRLATEGEELVTYRFPTGSIGLASPLDLSEACQARMDAAARERSWWSRLRNWLYPQPLRNERIPAVCVPPGARLRAEGVSYDLQRELGVGSTEEVTFSQLSAAAYRYRDGIRFENGREILLQYLEEGLRMHVLSLASTEAHRDELDAERIEQIQVR